jgi:hypothetical protein
MVQTMHNRHCIGAGIGITAVEVSATGVTWSMATGLRTGHTWRSPADSICKISQGNECVWKVETPGAGSR